MLGRVSVPLGVREDAVSLGVNALMYTSVEALQYITPTSAAES